MATFLYGAPVDVLRCPHYQPVHNSWEVALERKRWGYICATSYVVGEGRAVDAGESELVLERTILGASCASEYTPLFR